MSEHIENNSILKEGLQKALTSFFDTMIGTEATYKEGGESQAFTLTADVAGIMYLKGDTLGMVACGVSNELARTIISKMTGIEEAELSNDIISDGLAEIVNILCGFIKTQYPQLAINLTPPLSLIGGQTTLYWKLAHPSITMDFDIEGSLLTIAASL